jgi:hypothetical protein
MGGNNGRCPYANKDTHILFANKMNLIYPKMDYCHTYDRDNLVAFGECGSQGVLN